MPVFLFFYAGFLFAGSMLSSAAIVAGEIAADPALLRLARGLRLRMERAGDGSAQALEDRALQAAQTGGADDRDALVAQLLEVCAALDARATPAPAHTVRQAAGRTREGKP
jgi:hypothetical protein